MLGTENDEIYKIIEEEIDKNLLFMALDKLSDREKQIMELRFGLTTRGNEKTQKEVASILGISQSYISRLEKKIISRLKKEIIAIHLIDTYAGVIIIGLCNVWKQ